MNYFPSSLTVDGSTTETCQMLRYPTARVSAVSVLSSYLKRGLGSEGKTNAGLSTGAAAQRQPIVFGSMILISLASGSKSGLFNSTL
jgi:hypothetical protein